MSFDLEKIRESKRAYRKKLAALPIAEKLRMLDALRERALMLRRATFQGSANQDCAGENRIKQLEQES